MTCCGSERTVLQLGSRSHPTYVEKKAYDLAYQFAILFPATIRATTNLVQYCVPFQALGEGADASRVHIVEADSFLRNIHTESIATTETPIVWKQPHPPCASEFDRVTIRHEHVCKDAIQLKEAPGSPYRVLFVKSRVDAELSYDGKPWIIRLQEAYLCPYHSLADPDVLVFKCRPLYSIELVTESYASMSLIQEIWPLFFPRFFRMQVCSFPSSTFESTGKPSASEPADHPPRPSSTSSSSPLCLKTP